MQPLNAADSIVVSPSVKLTVVSPVQSLKAAVPIVVTVLGRVIVFKAGLSEKAYSPMVARGLFISTASRAVI